MSETPASTTPSADEAAAAERKKRYKKSLNLPKTSFPMRANLAQNEAQSRKRWDRRGLYREVLEARSDAPRFVFHDGPPYANGDIHVGHLLNKVLKDIVVRSRALLGEHCPFIPGWDCHGLPIEHRVLTDMVEAGTIDKLNRLDEDTRRMAIRRECQRYAAKYQKVQAEQMQRLLTLADYDEPYLTMTPGYEASVLEVFARMVEQGVVYRDLKSVHWSVANETALAEAELEYRDRDDPAVYVGFEAEDPAALAEAFGAELPAGARPSFLIWTTTPWTLPANLLIAVHRDLSYRLVRFPHPDHEGWVTVVAEDLLTDVASMVATSGAGAPEVLGSARGEALVGLTYRHPFADRSGMGEVNRVIHTDYVTADEGTGLVHTAPGHGPEDFATGVELGIPVYCPVREDGSFDDTTPEWLRGQSIWQGNETVTEHLRRSGHLLASHQYHHSYPHDWRSKTPVIFRATEQWFVAVDRPTVREGKSLRQMGLEAAHDHVEFLPAWGEKRLGGMLESRPDWCISRQRAWGLPIPAFRRPDGTVLLTAATVRAVAEAFAQKGSDAWFTQTPAELLATWKPGDDPELEAPLADGELDRLGKMHDIFDVWFESGSSWHAAVERRQDTFPVDLYLEGSDQHRGWFQLSLLTALGVRGASPFEALLTHGFVVDRDGKKMSKSLGNALDVDELLKDFGADVCRWWTSSLAYESDIKVDLSFFQLAGESYRKVRNTLRFLLSNLADFDPAADGVDLASLSPTSLDAWAVAEAADLQERVEEAYRRFEFRRAHQALYAFCNDTLSAFYLQAVKDRLYCDRPDAPRRRATQTVLHHLAGLLARLLAPLLPHTADEAWRSLIEASVGDGGSGDADACVHLETLPEPPPVVADREGWKAVLAVRERVLKALEGAKADGIENPLDAGVRLADPGGALAPFLADLADAFGVSRVHLEGQGDSIEILDLGEEPRCERSWRRDETVRLRDDGGYLSDRDADAVDALEEVVA